MPDLVEHLQHRTLVVRAQEIRGDAVARQGDRANVMHNPPHKYRQRRCRPQMPLFKMHKVSAKSNTFHHRSQPVAPDRRRS